MSGHYLPWFIKCKKDYDCKSVKYTVGKIYRIKDKFLPNDESSETWYEVVGDIGMKQIPHSMIVEYFDTSEEV